jgi:hypothetical protein
MKKQTAVQWYADKQESLQGIFSLGGITATEYYEKITELVKEAMELEKEQMKEFFFEGDSFSCSCYDSATDEDFEEYYNKTFNQ